MMVASERVHVRVKVREQVVRDQTCRSRSCRHCPNPIPQAQCVPAHDGAAVVRGDHLRCWRWLCIMSAVASGCLGQGKLRV